MSEIKATRTRNLRYKRPALATMGWDAMCAELEAIQEACSDIHWFIDQDDETLLNALDGEEDEVWEFKMAFADLEAKADHLSTTLQDNFGWGEDAAREYNDCTVALIGDRYRMVDFFGGDVEEDYSDLTSYDQQLAHTEAGERLMRMTKAKMLSTIGQCMGILVAFLDLRQQYDYLKATFDILRDENTSMLKQIKEIEAAYVAADAAGWYSWYPEVKRFERLLDCLPDRAWVE